ncbi:MAG: ATPase, T2SS/T4P/T4SS family [Patescibacteria group bacterium]
MRIPQEQLESFLLDSELISEKDLKNADKKAQKQNKKLEEVLIEDKKISQNNLGRLKAHILGIPFVSLKGFRIDSDILKIIPEPIAKKNHIVAFKRRGQELEVAMLDPEDLETIEFIKKKSNLKIFPRLTDIESIEYVLGQYQKSLEAEFGELVGGQEEISSLAKSISSGKEESRSEEDLKKSAEELPVVRIVDILLRHAILQRASDIHIEPMEKEVLIRYRIDGILHDAMTLPKAVSQSIVARIKVLSNLKLDEHRLPQDGRFKIETDEYKTSFRVSVFPVFDGEKVVIRLLPENTKGFTMEGLGFHGEALEALENHIRKPVGMILATGPTGSGKTTTLYSILAILNIPGVNISTIEDPVEYRISRVNQTQVRPDIGLTFANGLRSLLRQDPDVIMVGEIRDNETASLAINAALTGHQVLSTLHTNSAAGALPRMLDMKVEPFLIVSTVNAIIAQRLIRRLCKDKDQYFMSPEEERELRKYVDLDRVLKFLKDEKIVSPGSSWKNIPLYKPKSNPECPDGYLDRIGIHEVLRMSPTIKNLVMSSATSDDIEKQAKSEGMMTMLEDGIFKCAQGITTVEEVLRVIHE